MLDRPVLIRWQDAVDGDVPEGEVLAQGHLCIREQLGWIIHDRNTLTFAVERTVYADGATTLHVYTVPHDAVIEVREIGGM